MKKILIVLGVLLLIFAGALTFLALNANSLIEKYKPDLEKIASNALGAEVKLGKIEASIFSGAKLNVADFSLLQKGSSEALSLKNLALGLNILDLLSGKLSITELSLKNPAITIVKTADGLKIPGIAGKQEKDKSISADTSSEPKDKNPEAKQVPIEIDLRKFAISNAEFTFKDSISAKEYTVKNINLDTALSVKDDVVKITKAKITASVLGKTPLEIGSTDIDLNLKSGELTAPKTAIDILSNKINIAAAFNSNSSNGKADITSPQLNIASFLTDGTFLDDFLPPVVKTFALTGVIKPDLHTSISKDIYKATGSLDLEKLAGTVAGYKITDLAAKLNLNADLVNQIVTSENMTLSVNGSPMKIKLNSDLAGFQKLNVRQFALSAFSGQLSTTGSMDIGNVITFDTNNTINGMQIEQAMKTLLPAMPDLLVGEITNVTSHVTGELSANLMQSLKGNVNFLVQNGTLKGINLAGSVLKAVNNIPLIQGALFNMVPENKRGLVSGDDTQFKSITGSLALGGGSMTTNNLKLESTFFTINGSGKVGFNGYLDLNADITFDPSFSKSITGSVKELQSILDANEQLTFPLTIQGVAPKLILVPNVKKLVELAAKKAVREKAQELLDRALGDKTGGVKLKDLGKSFGF